MMESQQSHAADDGESTISCSWWWRVNNLVMFTAVFCTWFQLRCDWLLQLMMEILQSCQVYSCILHMSSRAVIGCYSWWWKFNNVVIFTAVFCTWFQPHCDWQLQLMMEIQWSCQVRNCKHYETWISINNFMIPAVLWLAVAVDDGDSTISSSSQLYFARDVSHTMTDCCS